MTATSECWTRLKELEDQLEHERAVHRDELAKITQTDGQQSDASDGQISHDADGVWATLLAYICQSSLLSSLLNDWCHLQVMATDDTPVT